MIIVPPLLRVNSFRWTLLRNDIENRSVFGSQSIQAASPVWAVSMGGVPQKRYDAMACEQFLEALEGKRNQCEMFHRAHKVPAGTLRSVLTLSAAVGVGALSLPCVASAVAGQTLLKGDLLGLGIVLTQQVVRVAEDAVTDSSGNINISINTPLRNGFSAGLAVIWNQPKALFRQRETNPGIEYVPGAIGMGWTLDLIEDWRP